MIAFRWQASHFTRVKMWSIEFKQKKNYIKEERTYRNGKAEE